MSTVEWVRVTRAAPCPVCGRDHYCSVSADGGLVFCTEEPSDRPGSDGSGWVHAVGPRPTNGHTNGQARAAAPIGVRTTRYELRDAGGHPVAVHVRRDLAGGDKRVWWELPDGTRGLGGRPPTSLPLYGADLLTRAAPGSVVVVTEGEKAADAVRSLGLLAVGTVTGAAACPTADALRPLVGFDVVLWPDNDEVGRRHMHAVGQRLLELEHASRIVRWPDAPETGDAADFVAAGLGVEELRTLYRDAVWVDADAPAAEESAAAEAAIAGELRLTDMGNAERLIARHGPDLRWCAAWKSWVVWGGETWTEHGDDLVQERAKETVRSVYEEADAAVGAERAQAIWRHATRSEGSGRVQAMIALARSAPALAVAPDDLDRDPWRLNCANGTVDLRRGVLEPFARADLMTKRSPARFDPAAACPTWTAFLAQIFAGDEAMIGFMQRAAGYCLSGSTAERLLFILFGSGRNGKSTWLEVVRHVLGDYASGTPATTIMAQRNKGIPNDVARLKGARFVSASETNEAAEIDEAFIKTATGGDTVTARFLNAEFFDFRPQFKIWLATNHKPLITGADAAVWDRIRLVPFTVRIPDDQLDKGLRDKLIAEADGVLAWMVAGCLAWQRLGALGEPEQVRSATAEYQLAENILAQFFEGRCDVQPHTSATAGALYAAYQEWAKSVGEEVFSQRRFGDRLRERGFVAAKNARGQRIWKGLRLLGGGPDEEV